MTASHVAYLGLGSNLGDRLGQIRRALTFLADAPGISVEAVSRVYETEPWGYAEQPAFLNAAARIGTTLGPLQLLLALKCAERQVGRERTFRWGPRAIDLDLLIYDDVRVDRRGLKVPHPGLTERAFVLVPLRDVYPDFRDSGGATIDELIARLQPSGIRGAYSLS